jgi:hypothetical protein
VKILVFLEENLSDLCNEPFLFFLTNHEPYFKKYKLLQHINDLFIYLIHTLIQAIAENLRQQGSNSRPACLV